MPVTLAGRMNASRQKFAVPNPKSVSSGTFKLSCVPSSSSEPEPNFFCAVSIWVSPNLLNTFTGLSAVVNIPLPLPLT